MTTKIYTDQFKNDEQIGEQIQGSSSSFSNVNTGGEKSYHNEEKTQESFPYATPRPAAYSEFAMAVNNQGSVLPSSALIPTVGGRTISVSPRENIQDAIDAVHKAGGGKVKLQAGTYNVTTALIGYGEVDIEGTNQNSTIIDFGSTSANLSFVGTDVYTTGTITSITGGINVTGSGTSWLANVTTDHQIFIGNTWYKIAAVLTDTTLTLSEGYQGNATLPGATYRAAKIQRDVDLKDITLKNSTGTALVATDCRNFRLNNIKLTSNNKGFVFTNVSEFLSESGNTSVSNTSNGGELMNARLCNFHAFIFSANGGHGFVMNNYETSVIFESSSSSNTTDGYNLTDCSDIVMNSVEASANGGQGIELVSGNSNIIMTSGIVNANTSDGIKLTATSDQCTIGAFSIINNGGYGINIAASSCDDNTILAPYFSNNTSGDVNDAGTSTFRIKEVENKFGGTGADGALSISSGTTTLNISGARVFVKNYTSISITGTGKLAFSNPHANGTFVFLRSQGNTTLTSSTAPMIDASGLGASGGAGASSTTTADGNDGTNGLGAFVVSNLGAKSTTGAIGAGGATTVTLAMDIFNSQLLQKYNQLFIGAGGGGASVSAAHNGNTHNAGSGGRGGGALIIECAGAWNFTTSGGISVAGANGSNASQDGGNGTVAGGGGGGGGGNCQVFYDTLTANTGTITVSGGTGGNCVWVTSGTAYGGGGGANPITAGSNGTSSSTNGAKTGGDGGAGYSSVQQYIY